MGSSAATKRHVVARVADIPPGERLIAEVAGRSIGVFNVDGRFYALRNSCPHQGGPLCLGRTVGLVTAERPGEITYTREGEILRCPWHGWEFDLATGRSVFDPNRTRVKSYPVEVEELEA
jgi:nitrite reductase (NADH) small subunit